VRVAWLVLFLVGCKGVPLAKNKLNGSAGGELYSGYTKPDVLCFSCHGGTAKGHWRAPGLEGPIQDMSTEQLHEVINTGAGWMPPYKDVLTPAEVDQILEWLRERFPAPVTLTPLTEP